VFLPPERPAGCCQQQSLRILPPVPGKALINGGVFAVYRENRDAVLCSFLHYDMAGGDKRLLVCKRHFPAPAYCLDGRQQAGYADYGDNHCVDAIDACRSADPVSSAKDLDFQAGQSFSQFGCKSGISGRNQPGTEFSCLQLEKIYIRICCQRTYLYAKVPRNVQGLDSYGTCRAEHGYVFSHCILLSHTSEL